MVLAASSAGAGARGKTIPVNTLPPEIAGNAVVGQNLTATTGEWQGLGTHYFAAWQRCDASGGNCASVDTTGLSYTVSSSDTGSTVRVVVYATNKNGTASASSAPSPLVAGGSVAPPPPVAPAPTNLNAPQITGTPAIGGTLAASAGSWSGSPSSYGYHWDRCSDTGSNCAPLDGATAASYAVGTNDAGATLRVTVTASNASGTTNATSPATQMISAPPPVGGGGATVPTNTALPQISGTVQVGQSLAASQGSWNGSPVSYGYQWQRCDSAGANCSALSAATASAYVLTSADAGATLRVTVSATNAIGSAAAVSAASAQVPTPAAPPSPAAPGTVPKFGVAVGGNVQWLSSGDLSSTLDGMKSMNAGWIRFDLPWNVAEPTKGAYDWSVEDTVVKAAHARGIRVLLMIGYTPPWARSSACPGDDKCEPANVSDYATFAQAAVKHYATLGVEAYEIWNEPNLGSQFWKPRANPTKYAALVRAAYPLMKAADPSATILAGALAPSPDTGTDMSSTQFLKAAYAAGLHGYFDALSDHPYYGPNSVNTFENWSAWSQMSQDTSYGPSLRGQMVANGDGDKKIWGTEANMKLSSTCVDGFCATPQRQADMITEAFASWKSYSWSGVLFTFTYHGNAPWQLTNDDWSPTPAWGAFKASAG